MTTATGWRGAARVGSNADFLQRRAEATAARPMPLLAGEVGELARPAPLWLRRLGLMISGAVWFAVLLGAALFVWVGSGAR